MHWWTDEKDYDQEWLDSHNLTARGYFVIFLLVLAVTAGAVAFGSWLMGPS